MSFRRPSRSATEGTAVVLPVSVMTVPLPLAALATQEPPNGGRSCLTFGKVDGMSHARNDCSYSQHVSLNMTHCLPTTATRSPATAHGTHRTWAHRGFYAGC